jgi:effector-binding domain-containing protein
MARISFMIALVFGTTVVVSAQQQPPSPLLPPPGSMVTPPAAPNPLAPPPAAREETPPAQTQPPGTQPPTADQMRTPDIGGPTEMVLAPKPVIVLKGQSTWDDGYDNLMEAFQRLRAEADRLKLGVAGRPQAAFTSTDDFGFKFDAMLTLSAEPSGAIAGLGKDFTVAQSPAGKALKFTHNGAYDDIDSTYEAITAYLDEKGLKATNIFVEEYVNDPKNSEDPSLEMNIYVLIE